MEMEKVKLIKYRFHKHQLVLVEEQSNQNEKTSCLGCGEVISGSSFSCMKCKYHLHKECAQAAYEIKHPLHSQHSGFSLILIPGINYLGYGCALCNENCNMFFYSCVRCNFALDIKCALSSHKVGESIYEFKDDGHQHPFIFLENHKDELKKIYCSWCHDSLVNSIYVSIGCNLHKKCFDELPTEIDHPCHRLHTLVLHSEKSFCFCEICQKEYHDHLFYSCFACKFNIHLECMWSKPIIEANRYHEHPFTLVCRNDSFICDACGTDGKFVSYICHTCHLLVHKNCTSLPRIIKVSRHDHVVFHKYFLKERAFEKHYCKICFEEVKTEYGSYHCLKENCNYIVHVKCAMEDDNLYSIIDQENQDGEFDETNEATNSSFTFRVTEENEHGKAVKIKHFNHEHNLVFEDKVKEDNGRHCDGCMLSISTPFYYCSECNFFLHKTCAELPKIKHHWFHRFIATLKAKHWFRCYLCHHFCSGLFYRSNNQHRNFDFCLRCATVPDTIKSQGHEHFLFFDFKCNEQCNACGIRSYYGAFRCKKCVNFALDFACMTLPEAIQNRCDNHLLKLTYCDENDDREHYCDICEENRDPNRWYYYCSTCDNSVHPKCVLGKYPFFKEGITWPLRCWHIHESVIFLRKVDGYPNCNACGKLCQDEAIKCSTCNSIVHYECRLQTW